MLFFIYFFFHKSCLSSPCLYSMHIMKVSSLCEWQGWQKKGERGEGAAQAHLHFKRGAVEVLRAYSAWCSQFRGDTTLNMLTSPLISTWKYLVLGKECEEPEIMSDYHSAAVILSFCRLQSSKLYRSNVGFVFFLISTYCRRDLRCIKMQRRHL